MKWLERFVVWTVDAEAAAKKRILEGRMRRIERRLQDAFAEMCQIGENHPELKTNEHYNVRHALNATMRDLALYKVLLGLAKNPAEAYREIRHGAVR